MKTVDIKSVDGWLFTGAFGLTKEESEEGVKFLVDNHVISPNVVLGIFIGLMNDEEVIHILMSKKMNESSRSYAAGALQAYWAMKKAGR